MNTANTSTHNSENSNSKLSFDEFVFKVCEKIEKIISQSPRELDKSKFHESFGVDDLDSAESDEIHHNFLYNIPNIIAYAYKEVGDSIRPVIFSLAKLYQEKTGEKFLGIDWSERKRFPVTKINEFIQERDLPDEYMYYLFGSVAFNNKFRGKKSERKDPKHSPAQLIKKSSLYRKLTLKNLDDIEYVEIAEYVRKLVTQSFGSMHNIQTVSDEDMLTFLIKKSKEEIEETKHQKQDEDEEADEGEDEMNKKSAAEFLGELEEISSSGILTGETQNLINQDNIAEYGSRIEKCRQVQDKYTESCIEKEIAQHALSITSRYKKNSPENYDTEPQSFQESQRYACFSGTWLLASLLQQYGFEKDRLFFADSFFSSAGGAYKHNYLIYKLANGKYIKIDYGFGSIYETTNFDTEIKNLEYGNPSTLYAYMGRVDNDLALHVYRLEDGISL
ncbi:hypothetical protein LR010_00970, partial [Candidatus Gracilibacteria bacterium]|nr:hypothetical protein [Candidatus Gracilibacteria bacterium]